MRTLTDIFGGAVGGRRVLMMMGSCALYQSGAAGGDVGLLLGAALTGAGWIICRNAGRKNCLQCSEAIKYTALKGKHCGSELAVSS